MSTTATNKDEASTSTNRAQKPRRPPVHYPFWFGGSAASMAAVVTHPLDLGSCAQSQTQFKILTSYSQSTAPDPHPQRPQNHAFDLHLHIPHARPLRALQRPQRRAPPPNHLLDRTIRRLRRPQATLRPATYTLGPHPKTPFQHPHLDVLLLGLLRRRDRQPR